ncbi:MAG: ABC transporter permease [Granulosicoccus sp.]
MEQARRLHAITDRFGALLSLSLVLLVWEASVVLFNIPTFVLPPPTHVVAAISALSPGQWLSHSYATLKVVLAGFVAATCVSIPLAVAISGSRVASSLIMPVLIAIKATPVVAVAPIIIIVLGTGDMPRVLITFLIAFFPIVVSTTTGLAHTPPELIGLSRSLRATGWRELWDIRLPYAVPHVFSGLKVASTLVVTGAVVGEFVAAERGLGYLVLFSTSNFDVAIAFVCLVLLVAFSLALFSTVSALQGFLFQWSVPKDANGT